MAGAPRTSLSPTRLIIPPISVAGNIFRLKLSSSGIVSHRCYVAGGGLSTCAAFQTPVISEGPSCIFVGPVETASQETLEALYRQAKDSYYSGKPLIMDDMFDRVELKLRWYGSKYVMKYPRCSLRRQSTYADAQEDPSQVFALASVWFLILAFGGAVCLVPMLYTINLAYQDALNSETVYSSHPAAVEFLGMLNTVLFILLGSIIGCPIASASARALQGLWRNDLVALKGACPNCGEEVFAFVRSDHSHSSSHRSDCHVCECRLEFRTKAEQSISKLGRRWVHGRVYLISDRRSRRR
ncbi:PGR5-like protein 1B, chloroplastic [Chenopodium quinoa]|uniref:PGR5-like protein 1B, chloroplastic n=1 Tax=Chenopodium quinoa TaxID=63459 RepID=UPI000B771441|nr:PGR5-like protein 1B, chloroplastic [Chenopodium quinoa]